MADDVNAIEKLICKVLTGDGDSGVTIDKWSDLHTTLIQGLAISAIRLGAGQPDAVSKVVALTHETLDEAASELFPKMRAAVELLDAFRQHQRGRGQQERPPRDRER